MSDDAKKDNVIPFRSRQGAKSQANSTAQDKIEASLIEQVSDIEQLPAIPELALRILKLRDNPDATVEQLVDIIMLDPALAAQVIRYANSPLFGQRGNVKTLDDAIFRVLGFETVMYLAIGTAMARAFQFPEAGKLGLNHFWRSATYSAALMQNVTNLIYRDTHLQPGISYLCGLLHNVGFLVLAQIAPDKYTWLNSTLSGDNSDPVTSIEKKILGVTHTELGLRLVEEWGLPAEIAAVVSQHHNTNYQGEFAEYVWLSQVTDQLLKQQELSDADSDELSQTLYEKLGLTDSQLYTALDDVLQSRDVLEAMVHSLMNHA